MTGATSGIGEACVRLLAKTGHQVVALGRRAERLDLLCRSLDDCAIHPLVCDVQDREALERSFASLPKDFSQVDSLVNNAGLMLGTGPFETLTPAEMQTMVMTNCMGVLHNTAVLLPSLRVSGCGHILNVTSVAAFYPYITGHVYAATKAFVEHFGANLRTELAADGVRVTNIAPGRTNTNFNAVRAGTSLAQPSLRDASALRAADVANAVIWALDQPQHVSVQAVELMPTGHSLSFR